MVIIDIILGRISKGSQIKLRTCTLFCFLSMKKQTHDFHFFVQCVIKQLQHSAFCDIQNNQFSVERFNVTFSVLQR